MQFLLKYGIVLQKNNIEIGLISSII